MSFHIRPSRDMTYINMALEMSKRSTCARRNVGCVLTNSRGHECSSGYNGPPKGWPHCIDEPCPGANSPSGTDLSKCEAIHAEINALLHCKDIYDIDTCYVVASPCLDCVKVLLNTSCNRIVFIEKYPHPEAKDRWEKDGRVWQYGIK